MRSIGRGRHAIGPTRVVEVMHQLWVTGKTLGCGYLIEVISGPKPVLVTKGAQSAFR